MNVYIIIMLIVATAVLITAGITLIRGNILISLALLAGFIGTVYLTFNPISI